MSAASARAVVDTPGGAVVAGNADTHMEIR
jgi:hypothetical protein